MNHARASGKPCILSLPAEFAQTKICVLCRIPRMNNDRHVRLKGQVQLPRKPFLLYAPFRFRPVVIKPDLSDGLHLRMLQHLFDQIHILLRHFRAFGRMHSHCGEQVFMFFRNSHDYRNTCRGRRDVNRRTDAAGGERCNNTLPVFVKCFIIIVCMCVKNQCVFFIIHTHLFFGGFCISSADQDAPLSGPDLREAGAPLSEKVRKPSLLAGKIDFKFP